MNGKLTLYIDQWGTKYWAKTVKELRAIVGLGGSRVSKMYRDKKMAAQFMSATLWATTG